MNSKYVIQFLIHRRDSLLSEKNAAIERFDTEINEIENALAELTGKKVWEVGSETLYDDQHPDYIKQSAEEI